MARKSKVVLENVELKPQVIGKTYKKKSNLLRVIFIFAIFILSVYYINDVSVYINNILGRDTADTISNPNNPDNDIENNDNNEQTNVEDTHYVVSDTLSFDFSALTLDNFKYENNILSFDINNNTNNQIDLSGRKIYLETYQQNNTLVERVKLNLSSYTANRKDSVQVELTKPFNDFVISEMNVDDYPVYTLNTNDSGVGIMRCRKGNDLLEYTFLNNVLQTIKHTISNSNVTNPNYQTDLDTVNRQVLSYNVIEGINASINTTENGYTAVFDINASSFDNTNLKNPYYYNASLEDAPKIINFEITYSGFRCN